VLDLLDVYLTAYLNEVCIGCVKGQRFNIDQCVNTFHPVNCQFIYKLASWVAYFTWEVLVRVITTGCVINHCAKTTCLYFYLKQISFQFVINSLANFNLHFAIFFQLNSWMMPRKRMEVNIKVKVKVKVKLSLCFLTKHHAMKANWGSGSIAPLILRPRH
jgi:hypothetical protein